jgi:hypothetical protein
MPMGGSPPWDGSNSTKPSACALRFATAFKWQGAAPTPSPAPPTLSSASNPTGLTTAWEGCQPLSGNSETIAEHLVAIGQAGFTVFNVALPYFDAIDRFAAEVIPRVRAELTPC